MKEAPTLLLRRSAKGLEPLDAVDAEVISQIPIGSDVEVQIKKRRSSRQHRLYWKMLGETVAATGKFPSAAHLHDEIKMALGYTEKRVSFDGRIYYRADSTAFEKMDGAEFKVFFDRAVHLIADNMGFDPLAFYQEAWAA